jgi:6-phosphogluconolactonase (cycloisomerase 2 family)
MNRLTRLAVGAGAVAGLSALAAPLAAGASGAAYGGGFGGRDQNPVFVQTDGVTGNQVVAYDRAPNGTLTLANSYATGGLGGVLNGSQVDHLGSEGSLTYDADHSLLYAVNAGSNTVSVFSVRGDELILRQVVGSGGTFPVSVAVHGGLVSVLNAQDGGSVQEFYAIFGHLIPVPGSNRNLGLTIPTDATQFTHTPGQVTYSPDGSQLIVTTKATTNAIDVFRVGFFGSLSSSPVVSAEPGAVPFAVTFDRADHLVVGEAGPSALATFNLSHNGGLTPISTLASGQTGLCWVTASGSLLYTGNTAANSTSGYATNAGGQLSLLGATPTDPGTVDGSVSSDGHYFYAQTGGKGIVDEFQINRNGSLTEVGSVVVPGAAGGQGIVAS